MDTNKSGDNIKPEELKISLLLPHYIIEELQDIAQFHNTTIKEEVYRAVLRYHAECMAEMIAGKLR